VLVQIRCQFAPGRLRPCEIRDAEGSFASRVVLIRYRDEVWDMNEGVRFQLTVSQEVSPSVRQSLVWGGRGCMPQGGERGGEGGWGSSGTVWCVVCRWTWVMAVGRSGHWRARFWSWRRR
jgi:hypothetical protein